MEDKRYFDGLGSTVLAGEYPSEEKAKQLKEKGYRIINLTFRHHDYSDFWFPTKELPEITLESILTAVSMILRNPGKYYVHCEAGNNRSPLVLGCLKHLNGDIRRLETYFEPNRPFGIVKKSILFGLKSLAKCNTYLEEAIYATYLELDYSEMKPEAIINPLKKNN